MQKSNFDLIVLGWAGLAVIIFFVLLFIEAPYGRFTNNRWGVRIKNKIGWFIMELPVLLFFLMGLVWNNNSLNSATWIIAAFFLAHYIHRVFIFPVRMGKARQNMPLLLVAMAVGFNFMNGTLNGYYLGNYSEFTADYFTDIRFVAGAILFITGMVINLYSDGILIAIRKKNQGYAVPYGGMYRFISCPNYFGEMLEWLGFAVICWNLPALAFFLWTVANLLPRALKYHKWYKTTFTEYPTDRKAILPFIL